MYTKYESDLREVFKSEVMGEALFARACAFSIDSDRKAKWRRLALLETQTRNRYLSYAQSKGISTNYPYGSLLSGNVFGIAFALLPWKTAMRMLSDGTAPFLEVFNRLAENAPEQESGFFEYVVAREIAIKEFADMELQGSGESLHLVNSLLEND